LPENVVVITFDDGYEDNFLNASPELARYGFTACFFVPSAFVNAPATRHPAEDRPMSWEQLRGLLAHGHEIGAHSVTHRHLTSLTPQDVAWEAAESKRVLEHHLQRPIDFFCYPAGQYNEPIRLAVKTSGYLGACTVEPGANIAGADPFALKRTEVSAFDSLWDLEKKLAGAYDWLHVAVQGARRMQSMHKRLVSCNR